MAFGGEWAGAGAGYLGPFLKAFSSADYLVSYFEGVCADFSGGGWKDVMAFGVQGPPQAPGIWGLF